ncbi:hypothetical protein CRG98_009403, partial [Punica granatum]
MQQGDQQTVLSLRPGGGRGTGGLIRRRFDSPSSTTSSSSPAAASLSFGSLSSDLPLLRPHGGGPPSLSFKAVEPRDEILKIQKEIEAELFGEEQTWVRAESNVPNQPQGRFSEPDNRDWRNRSAQLPSPGEERSWENIRENRDSASRFDSRQPDGQFSRQDQLNSQFARVQISSNQMGGPTPTLIKAEVPWSARRGNLSEKERVLKTVKGILNKLTPEKFDLLKGQLIDSGITAADILE